MKKMFLGSLLFISGFVGVLILVCLSVYNPHIYNGISGFRGFLLGTDTGKFFAVFIILSLLGIIICSIEAYRNK